MKKDLQVGRGQNQFFENSFSNLPDQIHKVILRFLSDLGDLKMRRMFVVYSSFLCWGIKPTSAQMAVMISPITIQSNNENCTETNTYYDRYFEIKYSTIKQRKLYEQVFGTIRIYPFKQSTLPCQKKKLFWRPQTCQKGGDFFYFANTFWRESLILLPFFLFWFKL